MPTHSFELPQTLRINNCSELKPSFDEVLEDELELTLTSVNLESIDAAGAQLLAALQIEVEKRKGKIIWEQPSAALQLAAQTLGFPRLS